MTTPVLVHSPISVDPEVEARAIISKVSRVTIKKLTVTETTISVNGSIVYFGDIDDTIQVAALVKKYIT